MKLVSEDPYGDGTAKCVNCTIYLEGIFFHCATCKKNVINNKKKRDGEDWENCDYCTNCATKKSNVQNTAAVVSKGDELTDKEGHNDGVAGEVDIIFPHKNYADQIKDLNEDPKT